MAVVSETPPGRRASGQCSDTLSDFSDDSLDLGGRNGPAGEALFFGQVRDVRQDGDAREQKHANTCTPAALENKTKCFSMIDSLPSVFCLRKCVGKSSMSFMICTVELRRISKRARIHGSRSPTTYRLID